MGGDVLKPRPAPEIDLLARIVAGAIEGAMDAVFGQDPSASGFPPCTKEMTGSDFIKELQKLPQAERRDFIRQQFANGNVPDFMREPVTVEALAFDSNGWPVLVKYDVLPNYLCIGTNGDHVIIPMDAPLAQELADKYGYSLPTAQMVDQMYTSDDAVKVDATFGTPGDNSPAGYAKHDQAIKEQYWKQNGDPALARSYEDYVSITGSPGLMVGHMKDMVLTDKMNDPNFAQRNAERLKGTGVTGALSLYGFYGADGKPIQDQGGADGKADIVHYGDFCDYAQGARMVSQQVTIETQDGPVTMSLKDALADPKYHTAVSSEGPMKNPSSYWKP